MKQVLFTRDSDTTSNITVSMRRLVDAGVLKASEFLNATRGATVTFTLTDSYGIKSKVVFMVNRSQLEGAKTTTLRSLTSITELNHQPKVGKPTTYFVSKKRYSRG